MSPWPWSSLLYGKPAWNHGRRCHPLSHPLPPGMLICLKSSGTLSSNSVLLPLCHDPERFRARLPSLWPTTHCLLHHGETKCVHRGGPPLPPLCRSLNGIIEQMEKFSSNLHDLSHKVEAMHQTTSQELAQQWDKQLKGTSAVLMCQNVCRIPVRAGDTQETGSSCPKSARSWGPRPVLVIGHLRVSPFKNSVLGMYRR